MPFFDTGEIIYGIIKSKQWKWGIRLPSAAYQFHIVLGVPTDLSIITDARAGQEAASGVMDCHTHRESIYNWEEESFL